MSLWKHSRKSFCPNMVIETKTTDYSPFQNSGPIVICEIYKDDLKDLSFFASLKKATQYIFFDT